MHKLYEMKLHETMDLAPKSNTQITRVPGGWIYSTYTELITGEAGFARQNWVCDSVFVPFNTEFQQS